MVPSKDNSDSEPDVRFPPSMIAINSDATTVTEIRPIFVISGLLTMVTMTANP